MTWLVRGYIRKQNNRNRAGDPAPYCEIAQYVPDINKCIRDAIGAGCEEIFIVKRGASRDENQGQVQSEQTNKRSD